MDEITEILHKWNACAARLEKAIKNRNYDEFRFSFRDGCRCFARIKEWMNEENGKEKFLECKEIVAETVSRWTRISEMIPEWMNEIKVKISKVKDKKQKDKKLGNAYRYMKKTGINLNVRAK